MFYWNSHSYSTQSRKSVLKVVENAADFFELSAHELEELTNSAGLSFFKHEDGLSDLRFEYDGNLKTLYENALISERMFRYYKTKEPTKQALLAIAISLGLSIIEINCLLHQYGYCLSKSLANDMVIDWFIRNSSRYPNESATLLKEINETLDYMNFPLLMTRLK